MGIVRGLVPVVRWLGPILLLMIFSANFFLLNQFFYQLTLGAQAAFYGAAALGYWVEGRRALPRWLSLPYYFAGANLALFLGGLRSLTRPATATRGHVAR